VTTEAQQLLDAAFAGTLNLDADANQAKAPAATDSEAGIPANTTTEQAAGAQATQDDEKPAPIASKSGEYTIPYEKLTSARTERDQYKAEAAQLREQLASLTAAQASNFAAAQQQTCQPLSSSGCRSALPMTTTISQTVIRASQLGVTMSSSSRCWRASR
jgi:hypothetical protein